MMNRISAAFVFVSLLFLTACDSNRVYEENTELPEHEWTVRNKLSFNFFINDTLTPHNFYFNVRNADDYAYSNIFVFMNTKFPNGKMKRDTIEFVLADESGRWLGKGQGDLLDNQLLYMKAKRFPLKGKYTIEVEQAMRRQSLPGIYNAGIRIEKAVDE
jgi:gliding motility-associated lipoprotein GldH